MLKPLLDRHVYSLDMSPGVWPFEDEQPNSSVEIQELTMPASHDGVMVLALQHIVGRVS